MNCKPEAQIVKVHIDDKDAYARKLADLYFMDSWISRTNKFEKDSVSLMLSKNFKDLHGISKEDFQNNLHDLTSDPDTFAEIMDRVGKILKNKGKPKEKGETK